MTKIPISSVRILNSRFHNNEDNGVEILTDEGAQILTATLNGNSANDNIGEGYDIDPGIPVDAHGNQAAGNADNTLP